MDIKSKFNIGDIVYSYNGSTIEKFTIKVITVKEDGRIIYKSSEVKSGREENQVFTNFQETKEAMIVNYRGEMNDWISYLESITEEKVEVIK